MRNLNFLFLLLPALLLSSCDAMLHMTYSVENRTNQNITLFIPDCPADSSLSRFGKYHDTVVTLKPNQSIIVGLNSKTDFPWATKNIYRKDPGKCGIERVDSDSTIRYGCSEDEWKYKKRNSSLSIK